MSRRSFLNPGRRSWTFRSADGVSGSLLFSLLFKKSLQALRIGIARDAALGDDGRHIATGGHVKRGMSGADIFRGRLDSPPMRYLLGRALLDRNFVPRGQFQVNRRKR